MRTFGKKSQNLISPTHLQWVKSRQFKPGVRDLVSIVLIKEEWQTITFVSPTFKYNMKFEELSEFNEADSQVWEEIGQDQNLFVLVDESEPKRNFYSCKVDVIPVPEDCSITWNHNSDISRLQDYEDCKELPFLKLLQSSKPERSSTQQKRSSVGKGGRGGAQARSGSPETPPEHSK